MSGKRKRPPFESPVTDRKYARCLETGHHYGEEMVRRDYLGIMVHLRVCRKCGVPETPRLVRATNKRAQ